MTFCASVNLLNQLKRKLAKESQTHFIGASKQVTSKRAVTKTSRNMKIDLTRIFLFYISSWVSVLSYTTSYPEDLDMSGDDMEYSGSGSGIGQDDVPIDNDSFVTVTNATGNSWATDAPPVRIAQQTTVKPAIDASTPLGSDSVFPVNTLVPRTETSNSDGILHHTTSVYSYDVMAERTSTTTKSEDKVDIIIVPETEELTTKSAMDSTSQIKEVVTTAYTTKEFTSASVSTTTSVIGLEEKVTVVTTTAMVETTTDSEDEVKSKTVPMPVQEFDETTTVPDEVFDAGTVSLPNETPAAPTTTTSAADITSGWGGSDDEGVLTTTSTQHTEFIPDFIENNIIPDVRRGVDIAKPDDDDDLTFDNEVGKRNTQKASAENQNILERKEVLAGVIAGGVVGVAFAVMLIALMAYRMKKKDEGSYALDDHKPTNGDYQKVRKQEEFLA